MDLTEECDVCSTKGAGGTSVYLECPYSKRSGLWVCARCHADIMIELEPYFRRWHSLT